MQDRAFVRHRTMVALPSDIGRGHDGGSVSYEDQIGRRPIGHVYDYVADFPRHAEWSGDGLEVTQTTGGSVAVGSVFSTTAKQFGTQRERAPSRRSRPAARSPGSRRERSASRVIGSRSPATARRRRDEERRDRRTDVPGEAHELQGLQGHPQEPSQGPRQHQSSPGRAPVRRIVSGTHGDPARPSLEPIHGDVLSTALDLTSLRRSDVRHGPHLERIRGTRRSAFAMNRAGQRGARRAAVRADDLGRDRRLLPSTRLGIRAVADRDGHPGLPGGQCDARIRPC